MFKKTLFSIAVVLSWAALSAAEVGDDTPTKATLAASSQSSIDRLINEAISQKAFPGAQVVVGDSSGIIFSKCYGYSDYSKGQAITDDEIYDLASCTKVLATTISVMRLMDEGALTLNTQVGDVIDRYKETEFSNLSLKQLLTHTTGFKPVMPIVYSLVHSADSTVRLMSNKHNAEHPYLYDKNLYICKEIDYDTTYITKEPREGYTRVSERLYIAPNYTERMDSMMVKAFEPEKLNSYKYSDINFYLLQQIVECTAMKSLDQFTKEIYDQMGLDNIGYQPLKWKDRELIAPTEYDVLFRRDTIHGYVHDEMAAVLGGVAGHAGLFANAKSVAALCTMFLKGGEYNGKQILSKDIVAKFTAAALNNKVFRGLGFDKMNPDKSVYSSESYGHTGFTGTYFWVDPHSNRFLVILTNRVHPSRSNKKYTSTRRADIWESAKLKR